MSAKREALIRLRSLGFKLKRKDGAATIYGGNLNVDGRAVSAEMEVRDWEFFGLPRIVLMERPAWITGEKSHLGADNSLCYARRDELLIDPRDVGGTLENCLTHATRTLREIAANKNPLVRDDEFFAHWRGSTLTFFVSPPLDKTQVVTKITRPHFSDPQYLFSADAKQSAAWCQKLGWKTEPGAFNVAHIKLDIPPAFGVQGWPPKNFADVYAWLKQLSPAASASLHKKLEAADMAQAATIFVLISSTLGYFGFYLTPDFRGKATSYYRKNPKSIPNHLLKLNHPVTLFVCDDVSPKHIHSRHDPRERNLAGKRILLIGCGTIGGFLATYLARLGAGFDGGALRLVDRQFLEAGNVGRHVLSIADIGRPKAMALKDHISQNFPHLDVLDYSNDIRAVPDLDKFDLILDATGAPIVSMWLNEQHQRALAKGERFPDVIYSWIEGQGEAAAAFLSDGERFACYECLWHREPDQMLKMRHSQLLDKGPHDRFLRPADCSSYMPFPVAASVEAASLALRLAINWVNGKVNHRLLCRRMDPTTTRVVKDQNPARSTGCPSCGT